MHELVAAYNEVSPAAQVAVHIKDSVNYYGWSTITFIQTLVPAFNKVVVSGVARFLLVGHGPKG